MLPRCASSIWSTHTPLSSWRSATLLQRPLFLLLPIAIRCRSGRRHPHSLVGCCLHFLVDALHPRGAPIFFTKLVESPHPLLLRCRLVHGLSSGNSQSGSLAKVVLIG
uniref:Uncharacterized protein n=1 Tax=Physcomitrium patens TaxID=3218 RepID=A0A2K1KQF8_PHYPA|nr:hypothetical protein PHYPA_006902 [Physcomitrium patens]